MTLRYPGRDSPALDGVSLTIRPGERIMVTGPSGAGKSSLLALLLRFAEPASGRIEAGGTDLRGFEPGLWRQQIAWVPQRPYLFAGTAAANRASRAAVTAAGELAGAAEFIEALPLAGGSATLGGESLDRYRAADVRAVIGGCPQDPHVFDATVRENVLLARPGASAGALEAAAARAGLLPWIRSLPLGWDTPVGAHGAAVSGGERQRIALARALLAGPAVLILDEPAAHLEPAARRALTAGLLAATRGRATLLITHDLDGLDQVDEIAVLAAGKVVQRGTHRELLRARGW